jgi:hypothetical protein
MYGCFPLRFPSIRLIHPSSSYLVKFSAPQFSRWDYIVSSPEPSIGSLTVLPLSVPYKLVHLHEGQTMLFLQRSSAIPVPRICALYQKPGPNNGPYSYIVMERIRCPILSSVWLKLGQTEKELVSSKLRHVFEEMHHAGLRIAWGLLQIWSSWISRFTFRLWG